MKPTILAQGAEAIIIREGSSIIKDRISKKYRHPALDKKIIKARTKSEAKILEKASQIIPAPKPTKVGFNEIEMPFITGKKLSDSLEQLDWKSICRKIGENIAKLHDADIIHGDLTTSNMILVENEEETKNVLPEQDKKIKQKSSDKLTLNECRKEVAEHEEATSVYPKLYFIDFGLGFISNRIEDKAVDLHLIKQALEAKHFTIHKECEKIILDNYHPKERERILKQLEKVEARGRYKH